MNQPFSAHHLTWFFTNKMPLLKGSFLFQVPSHRGKWVCTAIRLRSPWMIRLSKKNWQNPRKTSEYPHILTWSLVRPGHAWALNFSYHSPSMQKKKKKKTLSQRTTHVSQKGKCDLIPNGKTKNFFWIWLLQGEFCFLKLLEELSLNRHGYYFNVGGPNVRPTNLLWSLSLSLSPWRGETIMRLSLWGIYIYIVIELKTVKQQKVGCIYKKQF